MWQRWAMRCVLGAALLAPAGCGDKAPPSPEVKQIKTAKQVTPAQARNFADALEKAAEARDGQAMNRLIDWETLIDTSMEGLNISSIMKRNFMQGLDASAPNGGPFAASIVMALQGGGSYRFLRVREIDGQRRVLFRLLMPNDGGVNYHDITVGVDDSGRARAVDIYVYLTGEPVSQTFRRLLIPMAASMNRGVLDRLGGEEQLLVKHLQDIQTITQAVQSGHHQIALERFGQLPKKLQEEKSLQILHINAAQSADESVYIAAIEEMQRLFPNDPSMEMMLIDGHFMKKEWDKAIESVDRLDARLGGDPYLEVMRVGVLLEQGKADEALSRAQKAAGALPKLIEAHWTLLNAAVEKKDHAAAVTALETLRSTFGQSFPGLGTSPEFAELVASSQYKEWAAKQAGGQQ